MKKILEKAQNTNQLTKSEIIELLTCDSKLICNAADKVRQKYKGDSVHLRGLIEFSNICKCNCFYCGLRCENKNIDRYRLSKDEILNCVKKGVELGYKTIVLQSGEDSFFDLDKLLEIVKEIKKYEIALTLSIGERSYEEYKELKLHGTDRYLIRIETTDKELYTNLHPNMSFENRKECLYNLKELGYETGTGCLVGLPKQTLESLADDILFFKELNADMVGIGPFIPHPDTPLANTDRNNFELALKVMAITRLLLPDINIPATTAMETLNPNGRIIALKSGANVVMPNITTTTYRKKYEIYPDKICTNDDADKCYGCISGKIKSIGRYVSTTKGFRIDT